MTDGPPTCERCEAEYYLRDGDDPTKYCDHCAHERVAELEAVLASRPPSVEKAAEAAYTFWVVERFEDGNGRSLGYWTGHNSRDFTPNIIDAMQFVRRDDAMLAKSPWHWHDCEATEHKIVTAAAPFLQESQGESKMNDAQIKHMVNRFLPWRLPENFNPDGGISFKKAINEGRPDWPQKNEPVGTNLLDATQAEEMARHMIEGLPAPSVASGQGDAQERVDVLEIALEFAAKDCLNPEGTYGETLKRMKLIEEWIELGEREHAARALAARPAPDKRPATQPTSDIGCGPHGNGCAKDCQCTTAQAQTNCGCSQWGNCDKHGGDAQPASGDESVVATIPEDLRRRYEECKRWRKSVNEDHGTRYGIPYPDSFQDQIIALIERVVALTVARRAVLAERDAEWEKAIVEVCNDSRAKYTNDKQFAAVIRARLSTTETAKTRESEGANG